MYISVNDLCFAFFINVLILVVSEIDYAIIIKVGYVTNSYIAISSTTSFSS